MSVLENLLGNTVPPKDWAEYVERTAKYAVFDPSIRGGYLDVKLFGEFGELCEKVGKRARDVTGSLEPFGDNSLQHRHDCLREVGDIMWYVARIWEGYVENYPEDQREAVDFGELREANSVLYPAQSTYRTQMAPLLRRLSKNLVKLTGILEVDSFVVIWTHLDLLANRFIAEGPYKGLPPLSLAGGLNIAKLESRAGRGKLHGAGDHR
jgi:hypothetical protein